MHSHVVLSRRSVAIAGTLTLGGMTGCANVAATHMIPESFGSLKRSDKTAQVVVDTAKANDHFKNWVVDAEFRSAIEQSLVKANLFKEVSQSDRSDYRLKVTVTSVSNFWGVEARGAVNTTWELIDLSRREPIWKDVVQSEAVATISDGFAGSTRVRVMYERALKDNIRKGISQLSTAM